MLQAFLKSFFFAYFHINEKFFSELLWELEPYRFAISSFVFNIHSSFRQCWMHYFPFEMISDIFLLLLSFAHLFRSTNCNLTVNTFILYEHFFRYNNIWVEKFFFCINAAVRRANKKHKTIENVKFHFPLLLCLITIIWCSIYLYLKILFIYNRHCWYILESYCKKKYLHCPMNMRNFFRN